MLGLDVPLSRRIGIDAEFSVPAFAEDHYIVRGEVVKDQVGLGHWAIRPRVGVRLAF